MLSGLSMYFAKKTAGAAKHNIEILSYGYELALSTLMTTMLIMCIALAVGEGLAGLVFFASFVPVRVCAGGHHAKTFLGCNILSAVLFALLLLTYKIGVVCFDDMMWQCMLFISTAVILCYAPHENSNQPLTDGKRQKIRDKLYFRIAIELVAIQVALCGGFEQAHVAVLSLCLIAVLLVISVLMKTLEINQQPLGGCK